MALDDMDRYIIETTLNRLDGNVAAAARASGNDPRDPALPGQKIRP